MIKQASEVVGLTGLAEFFRVAAAALMLVGAVTSPIWLASCGVK